jgi:hypothetical protein
MLYIVTNISTKSKIGQPYLKIDGSPCKIYRDCIEWKVSGTHTITAGYGNRENLKQQIYIDDSDHWYQYKVPLIIWGTGRLIKISERKYKRLKRWCYFSRSFMGETAFLILGLLYLVIVMTVLLVCIYFI